MLYNSLKVLHIFSAALVLTSMIYSFHLWRSMLRHGITNIAGKIHTQTFFVIIPFALIQLGSGFTMISLQRENFTSLWIGGSVISFIIAILSWLVFIYFLILSQQVNASCQMSPSKLKRDRRLQAMMLMLSALSLLSMIFFMANKTAFNS